MSERPENTVTDQNSGILIKAIGKQIRQISTWTRASISPIKSAQMLASVHSTDDQKLLMSDMNVRPFNAKINMIFTPRFHLHAQRSRLCLAMTSLRLVRHTCTSSVSLALQCGAKKKNLVLPAQEYRIQLCAD